jgi:hypothetical protein
MLFAALGLALSIGCSDGSGLGAADDPEAGLRAILSMPQILDRAAALTAFLESLEPGDAPAVERTMDLARGDVDEVSGALIASWWASFDPAAAYGSSVGAGATGRALWESTVVREWARHDPNAVLQLVREIPSNDLSRLLYTTQALTLGWFYTDSPPAALLSVIESLPLGRTRNEAIGSFVNSMADRRGIEPTIEFVEALSPDGADNFKVQFYRRLATTIAHRDPQRAVAWAKQHAAGPYGRNLLRRVGARWGWTEGEPAMEWARSLPESEERDGIVRETYRGFRMRARERADAWIRAQKPTLVLEPAYALFLAGIAREEPLDAMALVDGIDEKRLRDRLTVAVVRSWMRSEPDVAAAWLQRAGLSPELMSMIRDPNGE